MGLAIDVVKRSGRRTTEPFDPVKLATSIRAACLSVRSPEGEAESTAAAVTNTVIIWVQSKPAVTSHDLRRMAASHLERYHPEAAYLYQHHQAII